MSGGEGKSDKGCAGAFWDGLDIKKLCCKNWSCKGGNIMLAFNENGKLTEYEETNFLKVCDSCHHIYKQRVEQQLEGMREREYDICPLCGEENDSSMQVDFYNSRLTEVELSKLRKKALIKTIIGYCDKQYKQTDCFVCDHQNGCLGECEGNCKNCLEEVHYPGRYPNGKKDYDCSRMLNFYVCDYSAKYASELLYLMRKSQALEEINDYHVLSIGCGGCPDLMAFERYCHEKSYDKSVSYIGIDVNEKWKPIHEQIKSYKTKTLRRTQFKYMDAVTEEYNILNANVIVLQYVISHFYNSGQIGEIESFFEKLVQNIILHKEQGKPLVVLINDVNSNNRGRDYFEKLVEKLDGEGLIENSQGYYFDYNIRNEFQRYGIKHESNRIVYNIPDRLSTYQPWEVCSSAQLLIEVL